MKYKMIKSDYEDGVSIVTIRCKYGEFTGTAQLHEDDIEYASKFFGCKIAEQRAVIKAYLSKIKHLKEERKIMYDVIHSLPTATPQFVIDSILADIKNRNKQIIEIKKLINKWKEEINISSEHRINTIKNIHTIKTQEQRQKELSKQYKKLLKKYNKVISD